MFTNRVEVISPGSLPNGMTYEAMRLGVSVRRNEFLLQHLARLGIVDALGCGIVLLYKEAAELGLPSPRIEATETWKHVTLFSAE